MKIGFVLNDYYPFGGLQEDCLATAKATQQRGHEVHIFTRSWKGDRPPEIVAHLFGKKGWSNIARNRHFFKALQSELPSHGLDGLVAFSRIPAPDIYFAADPCYVEREARKPWWHKFTPRYRHYSQLEELLFAGEHATETLVLTEREIKFFNQHYGTPTQRFHLLPPGVARNTASPAESRSKRTSLRQELGTSHDATVALFLGSGFRIKGLDRALRSIAANHDSIQDLEFWIVGSGKPAGFQKLAQSTGVRVRFLGGRADVDRFYDAADFLLHPAYSESAGKVLLEALTHGLPVLTTDTCGYAPHIIKAQAGQVISSPFSQQILNDSVRHFIQDTATRQAMSQNALAYCASEDLYSCHQSAAQIIEKILLKKTNKC
ncbi:glycosyltransferase family 4 protein [Thalassobacterium sedimentorum]|uniref:glycosyltransferase family 4 protein n=1 Tax=Thalassobacterium sedimentorum TaxID=3041258 RepID=UPI0028118E51|nr:glycosyltransferase family 4 protein [Coraliomargarita sp. SDUM461004]